MTNTIKTFVYYLLLLFFWFLVGFFTFLLMYHFFESFVYNNLFQTIKIIKNS